ncbi:hypothetical protein GF337_04650 [candidate division KSB1 bacterium]|nr:hypothetical protein [candidate division KSB1 bacterium]
MKALKIIGIIVLVIVVLIIVLGLVAPKKYDVERTVVIDAPKVVVFNQVKYWRNWQKWSPWAERDTTMKVTVEGKDGTEGSIYRWEGDPDLTGKGEMTNTGIKSLEEVTYHLHFMEPWESESDGYVRLSDVEGGTKVAWGFYGKTPFPWNIMMLFMSMDEMMAPDFDRGLKLLKEISEKEAEKISQYDVTPVNFQETTYAAVREEIGFQEMQSFYERAFGTIQQVFQQKGKRMTGAPVGLYFIWDEQNDSTDMAAAFPIRGSLESEKLSVIEVPESKGFKVNHYGSYEGLEHAHKALDYHIQENWLTLKAPVIEEYITDPMQEPDTTKWQTRIYYLVE